MLALLKHKNLRRLSQDVQGKVVYMKAQIIGNFHLILDLTTNDVKIKRMKTIVGKLILMSNLPPLRDRQRRQKCESSNGNSILVMRIVTNFGWLTVDKNNGTKRTSQAQMN
ncbi:hypothetical protein BLOT_012819 [Blomia tropicalis]|nr:hypothetical protein BLOT_012819 [Blomia tropicalis]